MNSKILIDAVETSIEKANQLQSKLPQGVLDMEGMSGYKIRHFLNNLMAHDWARYLEIGTWKGSTHISALYQNNPAYSVAIDDFSQYAGTREIFEDNCQKYLGRHPNFIQGECFAVGTTTPEIKDINVYFYDGEHSPENQRRALHDLYGCLTNEFIFIVDDWNWGTVRSGTEAGVCQTNSEVLYKKEFFTTVPAGDREGWWNGWCIFVLKKRN